MPTATDLVTDLPADFEVFGQAVDTDFVDLLGGTTGQVLSKTSATDLDFTWVTAQVGDITGVTAGTGISGGGTSGAVTVTNSMATAITTNGDIIYGTGSGTFNRLGIGSSAQVLAVSSGIPAWSTPSTGAVTQITTGTFTGVTSKSVDSCFTSTYKNYSVIIQCATDANTGTAVTFRYRASSADLSANSYYGGYYRILQNGSTSTTFSNPATSVGISFVSSIATTAGSTINLTFNDPLAAGYGHPAVGMYFDSAASNVPAVIGFEYLGSGTPDGFTIFCANAFSGSYKIYGWSN